MNCCNNEHKTEDNLISSLRKLVGRSEIYGSRPSLTIDVCSERQVQLMSEEIQDLEEEQGRLVSGFREVIDLISTSQRLVVVHNSLNDFAFIHSKFLAPLPPTMNEFTSSLLSVYPHILDINHLMKEIGLFNKMTSR
ncbi:poly(A)-specific ribonuclease PARN-like isoform X2 [Salvia miltiorrhiza]|uniref:poly(A)-specific ribonuclease PARN-like isoform X2 n=1 Tax=Salvia miltiorrhiza TaxID=226208 RepID=UPI0025ACB666|nr:poly(A)-specific ribonuclease PARN-like isoform X2 [Salvia miltiorrhiza]